MSEISVNYQELYDLIDAVQSIIDNNVTTESGSGYINAAEQLNLVDSTVGAALLVSTECNTAKTAAAAATLHRLSGYIRNAANELEATETQMANEINS
jgi:hypothetical protein